MSERSNISLTALYIGVPVLLGAGCYYLYVSRSRRNLISDKKEKKQLTPLEQMTHLKQIGNQNFSRKNYDIAIDHYSKAIEFSQENAQCIKDDDLAIFYQNRAACLEALGDHEKVIPDCDRAIDLKKNYTKAYLRRAKAYQKMEKYEQAMVDAFSANLLEKFQNQNSMMLTEDIVKASSKKKAAEAMKTHQPSWSANQTIKSYFSAFTQDPIKEKLGGSVITKAEQLQPLLDEANKPENDNDPLSLLIRGSCLSLMSQPKPAQECFDKVLAMENCPASMKANALIKKAAVITSDSTSLSSIEKDLEQVHELLDEAVKLDPENPDVYLHKAQTLTLSEKLDEAVETLEKAISLKTDFHSAVAQKFYIQFKLAAQRDSGAESEMIELLEKFKNEVKQNPDAQDLLQMHAQVLTEMGYFEQADQVLLDFGKLDPSDTSVHVSRALLQFHLKSDPDDAAALLREALKVDPKIIFAYEILGSIENQRGRIEEAIKIFETATRQAQSETEYARCFSLLDSAICQKKATELLGMQV